MKKAFMAAATAIGVTALSACTAPPPTETQRPNNNERRLTQGEIEFAQTIFGDQINYNRIFVRPRNSSNYSMAYGGRIRMSSQMYEDDYSQSNNVRAVSVFMHEMVHIWQEQNGVDIEGSAVDLFFEHGGDYSRSYEYSPSDLLNYGNLSIEQQAEIIEDYVHMRLIVNEQTDNFWCPQMERYEDALEPHFPAIEPVDLCR